MHMENNQLHTNNGKGTSLEWIIVDDRRRLTSGHRKIWREEEDKKKIMGEPSDGLHEKQKHERSYGRR